MSARKRSGGWAWSDDGIQTARIDYTAGRTGGGSKKSALRLPVRNRDKTNPGTASNKRPSSMNPKSAAAGGLSVEDRLDIQQLIAAYNFYEDSGDAESWGQLFTVDGGFTGSENKAITGRDNLIQFAKRRWNEKPQVRKWVHWVSNVVIEPSADGARAKSYQMTIEMQDDGYRIHKTSIKLDELRRENGQWRFYMRRFAPLPPE
jgi:hypothetical protein